MSIHEEQQALIQECIPKLIKTLTGFEETDENFGICEQFAWSKIQHHRYLSVNSHEIKRRVLGLFERFTVANYEKYAQNLRNLYEAFIQHPLCLDHYETDIQWAILNFLLDVSYNPVGALTEKLTDNLEEYELFRLASKTIQNTIDDGNESLVELLKSDNLITEPDCSSDLSDWSDSDIEDSDSHYSYTKDLEKISVPEKKWKIVSYLEPPKKPIHYILFDTSKSEHWFDQKLQRNWWLKNTNICKVGSVHNTAKFCDIWNKHLSTISLNFIKFKNISTYSEYCLLREIFWMFFNPKNCVFFHLNNNQITINPNVSVPSITVNGLQYFLEQFIDHMTCMYQLETFCKNVLNCIEKNTSSLPHTYECYVTGLQDFLEPIKQFLIKTEQQLLNQYTNCINTIMNLYIELIPHFKLLKKLYEIHSSSVLDWTQTPAHICSAHLLAGIFSKVQTFCKKEDVNLALVLYMKTFKTFFTIIDTWWSEGRLDDWKDEFLIEKKFRGQNLVNGFAPRLFEKCKEISFYVKPSTSNVITNDPIIKLLLNHLLKAASTLNVLHVLDRIGELKMENDNHDNLYKVFCNNIYKEISEYFFSKTEIDTTEENSSLNKIKLFKEYEYSKNGFNKKELEQEVFSIGDEFLLMAFDESLHIAEEHTVNYEGEDIENFFNKTESYSYYNKLNNSSSLTIPFEEIIFKQISSLLDSKFSVVNRFVVRIYKEEFCVLHHLQNLRKVLLLEASDLMHCFYASLFQQIEAGGNWANPYLLTVQLDGIMCARYSDMVFSIEIESELKSETNKVMDAIDQLKVNYNVSTDLANVINDKSLISYNKVFRFLLKVKWGLWTLENLRFPESYKKRRPYSKLNYIDLVMRRLAMLRFWMIYAIQYIHSHLMTQILQSMGTQLDKKINDAKSLTEIILIHESFIETVDEHCFQNDKENNIRSGIIQLLNLIIILRDEWNSACLLNIDEDAINLIGQMETTYIKCHQYLAETLSSEIYTRNSHLAGLSAAFNCSIPY